MSGMLGVAPPLAIDALERASSERSCEPGDRLATIAHVVGQGLVEHLLRLGHPFRPVGRGRLARQQIFS